MSAVTDRIAEVLDEELEYLPPSIRGWMDPTGLAERVAEALQLTEETRRLDDGYGGISGSSSGAPIAFHSRPQTRQHRWVTGWEVVQ